ncbi:MAG: cysteine synthase A [Bdellovibrionales bacterium]|nr:cysteine synthase A [Bdellovibrionales bacterium]
MKKSNFIQSVGNTPLIYLESLSKLTGCEIYGKAEFMNPGGSVKDRAALGMIRQAEKDGRLKPGGLIVEGTSGNTGIGLALIGNILGYKTKITIPNNQAPEKIDTMRGMGAEVLLIPPATYPDPANYRKVAERIAKEEGGYYINQFDNQANYMAHYKTTGPEIWEQSDQQVTGFVCAIGTGGTLAGISKFLKEKNPKIQVGCTDPVGSSMYNYFTRGVAEVTPGETISEGIGQGVVTENVRPCEVDHAFQLSDQNILDMVHYIVRTEGLFVGSSTGANLCGAYLMARKLGPGNRIVTILCDSGQKYISKIFNPAFLQSKSLRLDGSGDHLFPALDQIAKSQTSKRVSPVA